ncbi:Tra1p-like C-terminal FAT domain plus phoshoinositide 3-kinase domain very large [Cryptosporidium sp. chipmunk genotype I]|uniref:Tra1p-like C-terminal FAT domain plus phoshoinositide 3-kinase domain very large n=1 Tax=Cryptosporidium sp. chipmunk genotype I TaxID=1280935 RepID=UPI003519DD49|nr:Tra1p-like C-terminal FAT domain plus phoshoinositide 3-kinase domain very large [Cryptosporidium sp. chipmunk genotype I]
MNIKEIGTRLKSFGQNDLNEDLEFLTSIRDHIELYTTDKQTYFSFLEECLDGIRNILLLNDAAKKHDYKKSSIICMEIISLLPQNEVISNYCLDLAQLCLHLLDRDTDDIGVLAIRNLVFLHKNYTDKLENVVESFLGFASRLCTDVQHTLPQLIQEVISNRNNTNTEGQDIYIQSGNSTSKSDKINSANDDPDQLFFRGALSTALPEFTEITNQVRSNVHRSSVTTNVNNSNPSQNMVLPCHQSLRILIELPLALLHIFQLYPHFIERYFAIFAPNLASCLNIVSLFPRDFHPKLMGSSCISQNHTISQLKLSPEQIPEIVRSSSFKSLVQDYMIACSKIILWFVHFFRGFNGDEHVSETLRQTQSAFTQGFIQVLLFCPPYCLHQRREILVCLRSILNTEFRQGFYDRIEILLDEAVLIGHGRTGYETLKVLSSAILHEIVVYLRVEHSFSSYCNNLNQDCFFDSIMKCLHSLTRNILDTALPLPAQHYCIRSAAFLPDILKKEGFIPSSNTQRNIIIRDILLNILSVFSLKIHQLRRQICNLVLVSMNREIPGLPDSKIDSFTFTPLKPKLGDFLDEFIKISNIGNWLDNSFSYANTQIGHCEISITGCSALKKGLDSEINTENQTKPLIIDILRELRPILRATIIGARQTIFHITTLNRNAITSSNTNNKNILSNTLSGINGSTNNNANNIDITRFDVRKLANGIMLNEAESKLLQKILIEGIICSVEYCQCFQYTMSSTGLVRIKEGGSECQIIPTSSLIIPNNTNQSNYAPNQSNNTLRQNTGTKPHHNSPLSIMPEEKELLELLASVMCYIHPQSFGDIIQATFSVLFEWSTSMSPQISLIFHYWGVQQHTAKVFYESILPHLMLKLDTLAIEPNSEFTELRSKLSPIQILLKSLNNKQLFSESIQHDISSFIAQVNNMSIPSTPLSCSIYPTEHHKLALSRYVVDPHIDNVEFHSKIPYSRGRISHFGTPVQFPESVQTIIDPRDDSNNLINFAPTAAPHGNPDDYPFPFDILTQNINISLFQIQKNITDLPIPDTFVYGGNSKNIQKNKTNEIASGLVTTRLLKQLFRYIGQNPQHETIIIPYVVDLCTLCTSMASKYQNNIFFLSILRSLFRSITPGGKASGIYKEFLVILPWFLDTTIKMQKETKSPYREIWLEISLTVPARLKSLLPYMGQLISPMLNALESNDPELVLLALRSLDLWIDNLHHDFLYPILTNSLHQPHRFQTRPSILVTLCKLLKPAPPIPLPVSQVLLSNFHRYHKNNGLSFYALQSIAFQHATLVGRILGKLGGKNRWFLKDSAVLDANEPPHVKVPILIRPSPINNKMDTTLFIRIDDTLQHVYKYLSSTYNEDSISSNKLIKNMCNTHIKNLLLLYLSIFWTNIGTLEPIKTFFSFLTNYLEKHSEKIEDPNIVTPFSMDYISECNNLKLLSPYVNNLELFTKSLILALSYIEELHDSVGEFCDGLTNYLAIYSASRSFIPEHCNLNLYWSNTKTDPVAPMLSALFDTIDIQFTVSHSNHLKHVNPSYIALIAIKNTVKIYYSLVENFPLLYFNRAFQTAQLPCLLESNIVNLCYDISWNKKTAACVLIIELLNHIPPIWAQTYFQKLSDALFFISKDSGADSNPFAERCSEDALDALIYSVFTGIKPVALFGNCDNFSSKMIKIPISKYGITIPKNKLSLLSGESININDRNWEDLLTVIHETNELKRNNSEFWWSDSYRVYLEMLITESRDKWYSGVAIREEIMNSLANNTPADGILEILRKHLFHLCMNSITPNILSLRPACRRMSQKCLITLSNIIGVSVATLLNTSFSSQFENNDTNNLNATSQTTLLQQLLSRLQTKLISTCSTPYQLAFLDTLCFIASLRPPPIGIPSTIIRRFVEDIFVVIRDEIDSEMNDSQQKNSNNSFSQSNIQVNNHNSQSNKSNPEFRKNRIQVQIYSIRFLKLILLHPNWSEFLRSRNNPSISVPVSANISPVISPAIPTNCSTHIHQSSHYQQNNQLNHNSHKTNLNQSVQLQQTQQPIPVLAQQITANHQTQISTQSNHQNLQNVNQSKKHYPHQIYQSQHQTNANQQLQMNNQLGINQSKTSQDELRWKIIGILFRCVTRKDLEICKAAHHTLKVIVRLERYLLNTDNSEDLNVASSIYDSFGNNTTNNQYELLPEDQLRHCLRPVLVHLASATKLTVHVLQGLARLLELLCFCFNVTLGEKLLQHLQRLCWPNEYQREALNSNNQTSSSLRQAQSSSTGLANTQIETFNRYEEDLHMAIAMVCIFHLLPQGSDEFVSKVVGTILGTRNFPGLDRSNNTQSSISSFITSYTTSMTISSPFRLPLALFATHSPHNVVLFLIQQLASDRYANFLIDLIKMNPCSVIRIKLYQLRTQLIEATVNRVLEEAENVENKRDSYIPPTNFSQVMGSSVQLSTNSSASGAPQNINKTNINVIPVSPAFTESYSSAWNGIRVLSSLCEEWPSLLVIDFLEYYASSNRSVLTIIDILLTMYNTIFNRLIVFTKSGGISTHGNFDNKFELSLAYQGTVAWQHPWSFFHSNECFMLYKMLIGFYTATNNLENIQSKEYPENKYHGSRVGDEIISDILSVQNSMRSVLYSTANLPSNSSSITNLSQSSASSFQRQNLSDDQSLPNNFSFNSHQSRHNIQNSNTNLNSSSHTNNSQKSVNSTSNSTSNNQALYPSQELIMSLLSTIIHGQDVKEHLKRRRIDVILTIATLFGTSSTLDSGAFRDFLICTVPKTLANQEKRLLFNQLIQRYYPNGPNIDTSSILPGTQIACIQLILIPLLEYEFNKNNSNEKIYLNEDSWLNDYICEGIITRIILPSLERSVIPLHGTNGLSATDDPLKIEILKLLILLVKNKYSVETLSNNRKRIIKDVWNILRTESSLLKSWGYITMCYFVEKYPFPEKILFSMLVALTRLYGVSEVRLTVRRALNLFIPLLYTIKPIIKDDSVNIFSTENESNKNLFSLVPSPPKLLIKDKTPETLFSNWLRLMIAILIQDSYNLPLQQQLYHWNIITLHPNIFAFEYIYLLSPILSTLTKLLWGFTSVGQNSSQSTSTSYTGSNSGMTNNFGQSTIGSNNILSIPFLPEMKRMIFDILIVITSWICEFDSDECLELKRRKISHSISNNEKNNQNLYLGVGTKYRNVANATIDISSIPQLTELLKIEDEKSTVSIIDLLITIWFRLALLASSSDHKIVAKSFNIISKILLIYPDCKAKLSWLDIGFNLSSNSHFSSVSNSGRPNIPQNLNNNNQGLNSQSQSISPNFIAFQLTLIAGLQVFCIHQTSASMIMQLEFILQILEPAFVSNDKNVSDALYVLICKIIQIIPHPSTHLKDSLANITNRIYSNEENSQKVDQPKELDYNYINNFKTPLSKKVSTDNKIDSFYIKLVDISASGIWSLVNQEFSVLPELSTVKIISNSQNMVYENSNLVQHAEQSTNYSGRNVSLYTSIKLISSFMVLGIALNEQNFHKSREELIETGFLFLRYLSPLIIYVLDRTLTYYSGFNSQNLSNLQPNVLSGKSNLSNTNRNTNVSNSRANSQNLNVGGSNTLQHLNGSNISILSSCAELFQLILISPYFTIKSLNSDIFRHHIIVLLRDFGLITFQGGIVHLLINILGRWIFNYHLNINVYLLEKLEVETEEGLNLFGCNPLMTDMNEFVKSGLEERRIKVYYLDDILRYYSNLECESKMNDEFSIKVLKYELVITLLTGWSLICDRNRRFEMHLIYHAFLEEILNNQEDEILEIVFSFEEKLKLKDESSSNNIALKHDNTSILTEKVLIQLEKCALLGLASPHPKIKFGLLKWFNKKLPKDLFGRLRYLFTTSNFDVLAERFYITQFLELLIPTLTFSENSSIINNKIAGFPSILPSIEQQIINKLDKAANENYQSSRPNDINYNLTELELEWWELQNLQLKVHYEDDNVSTSSNVSLIDILDSSNNGESNSSVLINRQKLNNFLVGQIKFNLLDDIIENLKRSPSLAIDSLLFFSSTSETISISFWKTIFPWIWNNLENQQRNVLTLDIIDLLSKERHHRVSSAMPSEWTIPYVILDSLLECNAPPILPSTLLLHLSTKLRCWHIASNYLSNQMAANSLQTRIKKQEDHFIQDDGPDSSWMILAQIYGELQEEDIVIGIRRSFSNCLETHMGLALMQQAEWSKAQEIFYNNLDAIYNSSSKANNSNMVGNYSTLNWARIFENSDSLPLNNETMIWIDSWVACAKHLNQWNTLNEFAKERRNPQLQLECSSKLQDWVLVEKLVNKYILHNPITKLCQAYHSLYDLLLGGINSNWNLQSQGSQESLSNSNITISNQNRVNNLASSLNSNNGAYYQSFSQGIIQNNSRSKLTEFERHCSIGYRTVLNFWAMLPSVVTTCHVPLLLNFQQYIELQEGFRLSSDIERKLYPDGPNSNINHALNSSTVQNSANFGSNYIIHHANTNNLLQGSQSINTGHPNSHGNNVSSHSNVQNTNNSTPGYFEARMLNVWRDRLPNKWDSMILWNDLFVWRNFVFSIIMNLISRSDHLTSQAKSLWPSYLQDMPWTMIKFASIARKSHRLPEVSVALLQRLQNHLQVSGGDAYRAETFLATLEKVKLCLSDTTQLRTGLNILNMTDFQKCPEPYFDEYRAEFLRLKGVISNKLYPNYYIDGEMPNNTNSVTGSNLLNSEQGHPSLNNAPLVSTSNSVVRVNADLLSSLKVYPLFARGWITWAQYTDRLLYIHQNMSYAVNAVISYLMGIYLRPDKYSILLSRVLWLLPHDSPDGKYLSLAFKKYSDHLPCAVWLPWIPQLIAGIDRIEGSAILHILNKIVLMFPQSIYFNIRCSYLEKREMAHMYWYLSSNSESENKNQGPPPPPSSGIYPSFISLGWQRIESLMNTCRIRHGALTLALEHWVEDIVLHCKPDPLDELLCAIRTLFQMTIEISPNNDDSIIAQESNMNDTKALDIFPNIGTHFLEHNIIRRYEQLLSKSSPLNNQSFERSKNIIKQYWNEFKSDFHVNLCNNTNPPIERVSQQLKLDYVLEKLKKWKDHFTKCTERYSNENIRGKSLLSDLSTTLCDLFHRINIRLEVPGQYLRIVSESLYLRNFAVLENTNSNNPIGGVIYLHRSLPTVETVVRQSYTLKRIGFITSSGSTIHFLIQPYSGLQQKVEERILHLQVTLNTLLYKYKETRSRNISFAIQPCIPLHPRCRIIEDTGNKKSFTELFEDEANSSNGAFPINDLDFPILLHRKLINVSLKKLNNINNSQLEKEMLKIYSELCDNWVPEDIFKRSILKKFNSHDQSFLFTKQFTTHLGLLSIFSYILGVNDVTPGKLFVSLDTGQVYQSELKSSYVSSTLLIDKTEKVPFRLTRNMENLMGPFGKNGILPGTMLAFAHCLQKYEFHVRNLLCSLLRDDLHAFSVHRALQIPQHRNLHHKSSGSSVESDFDNNSQTATINSPNTANDHSQNTISQMMQQRLLSNVEIREKVDRNVRRMMEKIAVLTNPRPINESSLLIDKSVLELIECSTDPKNLSAMKPTWMPWL